MTTTPSVLYGPATLPSAAPTALFTIPANTTVVVNRATVNNITNAAVTLQIWVVRDGDAEGNGNLIVGATAGGLSITAGPIEPYTVNAMAGLVLAAGDAVWAQAGTATALNMTVSGYQQT